MKPIVIYDKNQIYTFLSNHQTFHIHMKHIEICHHLVQDKTFKRLHQIGVLHHIKHVDFKYIDQGIICDKH
jgi:hypothetical protein